MGDIFDIIDKFIEEPSDITANRLSIINGKYDITEWETFFEEFV